MTATLGEPRTDGRIPVWSTTNKLLGYLKKTRIGWTAVDPGGLTISTGHPTQEEAIISIETNNGVISMEMRTRQ